MDDLPLFPVSVVGSWPRPPWLLDAARRKDKALAARQDEATLLAIKLQEEAGVDIISDGEQRRESFYSFLGDRVEGIELLTLAELLDHVEDKAAFEAMLQALDVPAFAISNPTVTGPIRPRAPLALDDLRFLQRHTRRRTKVTLPGPYLLSRSMWVQGLSDGAYPTREALADDVVRLLGDEMAALAEAGATVIQLDEPVLSELVLAGRSATRTFMCAALAASADPAAELEMAVALINRVARRVEGAAVAVHVCRGNWSSDEGVLLEGSYDALMPTLRRLEVTELVLEYATPRAGTFACLAELPQSVRLGLGVVNPRTEDVEPPEWVAGRAREAAEILGPERVTLNPDCGFGTFASRPVATAETAAAKLRTLVEAAALLRREAGAG